MGAPRFATVHTRCKRTDRSSTLVHARSGEQGVLLRRQAIYERGEGSGADGGEDGAMDALDERVDSVDEGCGWLQVLASFDQFLRVLTSFGEF